MSKRITAQGQQLLAALIAQDKEQVERLLSEGADLNEVYLNTLGIEEHDHEEQTLFSKALDESEFSLPYVRWLITLGADPSSANGHTDNPLYWAVWLLDYWLCHLLLNAGANPNIWTVSPGVRETALDRLYNLRHYEKELGPGSEHLIKAIEGLLKSHGAKPYSELSTQEQLPAKDISAVF